MPMTENYARALVAQKAAELWLAVCGLVRFYFKKLKEGNRNG